MNLSMKINKHTMLSFFSYIFIVCLILNMRCIWTTSPQYAWTSTAIYVLTGGALMGGIIVKRHISYGELQNVILLFGTTFLYAGIYRLFDPIKSDNFFKIPLQLLFVILYCMFLERSTEDTLKKYSNIVLLLAVISVFFWMFGSVLEVIRPNGYLVSTWTGHAKTINSYFGLYFEPQKVTFLGKFTVIRNCAIFVEAPMASLIFSMAFLAELMKKKIAYKRCFLFLAADFVTFSVIGLTAIILAVCLRYLFGKATSRKGLTMKMFVIPFIVCVGLLMGVSLINFRLGTSSGTVRLDDLRAGYLAWRDSPLFGNGFDNAESIQKYMSTWRSANMGFSNSFMQILAYGGVYLFAPYMFAALSGGMGLIKRKKWLEFSFYAVFLYEFLFTIISFQMLTFYFFVTLYMSGTVSITKVNQCDEQVLACQER